MPLVSINPATGVREMEFPEADAGAIEKAVAESTQTFRTWKNTPLARRVTYLERVADVLDASQHEYARLMALEMGKPITSGIAEIQKCALTCRYYAKHAAVFLADEHVETEASRSVVRFEPLGIVLAIMPWNFPFWQVMRFATSAIAAGNTVILKHASNVPQCALALQSVFEKAGCPAGLFTTLLINSTEATKLIADPRISAITFTGSTPAGRAIAAAAGSSLKKAVLELGGSDPFIILDDADTEAAARTAVIARMQNCGQSCIASKRFIVTQGVYDQFIDAFAAEVRKLIVGDPFKADTQVGPLARADLRDALHAQVTKTLTSGARLIVGGKAIDGPGCFYEPTIIADVVPGMPLYDEEVFGPVAAVIRAEDPEDAIRIANDTPYGLGSSLWTRDLDAIDSLVHDIDAGAVFVNALVKSDPRIPFGGIKASGYGRELGKHGIQEFTNKKTVWIA